jgi:DNA (cytosine-5)-methyltransferase 1
MNELHLFAGAGGGILGGILLGHTPVCAVEIEPYCRKVLLQRQRDGILPKFPIWDNVTTFDGTPWRGKVDVVCGGFPCQDISSAGGGAGIEGERSGLWSEMARIIGEIRPKFAFMENSPMLTFRGLGRVLGDLSELGYDARWGVLGAHHVGAPHRRDRIWIVGNSVSERLEGHAGDGVFFNQCRWDFEESRRPVGAASVCIGKCDWWASESGLDRVVDGVANLMDRIRCIGNGQVPIVAALAFQILGGKLK